MGLFSIEHSPAAYRADFVLYGLAVPVLAAMLIVEGPPDRLLELLAAVGLGTLGWSLAEYLLHRFVLHGVPPFSRWHAEHHRRPSALIGSPTLLSATLIAGGVFAPLAWRADFWLACAVTLGVATGYLAYTVMHHVLHHWHQHWPWLMQRQRFHVRHHQRSAPPACYGVTSPLWDRVFGTSDPHNA